MTLSCTSASAAASARISSGACQVAMPLEPCDVTYTARWRSLNRQFLISQSIDRTNDRYSLTEQQIQQNMRFNGNRAARRSTQALTAALNDNHFEPLTAAFQEPLHFKHSLDTSDGAFKCTKTITRSQVSVVVVQAMEDQAYLGVPCTCYV